MPLLSAFHRPFPSAKRKLGMVLAALLLTLLAHLAVIEWLKNELQMITLDDDDEESTISISLQQAPPPEPPPKPAAKAPPDIREPVPAVPALPAMPEPPPAPAASEPAPPPVAGSGSGNASTTSAATTSSGESAEPQADSSDLPPLFTRASPPPPVELSYTVIAIRNGSRTDGNGTMSWRHDGQRYQLTVEMGILFFTLLKYRSEGDLGKIGVIPELYAEKRVGRSETNTHFHRQRQQISFSASTAVVPVRGGEQDRGSWIWQLASLGRGDPDKFEPGLAFEMTVAGTKAVDTWRIYVNGRENVALPGGSMPAWRLSVIPGAESYERQFDLWLAPERQWYPVRLRHEDKNGNSIEMQMTKIQAKNNG